MRKSAEELLRESVKARIGGRTQRSLAKAVGVSDSNMSDFLKGEQGLGLERLAPLAKELGCTVADLFQPVRESPTLTDLVTGQSSNDQNPQPGDVIDAAEAGLLRARTLALENENAALRAALRVIIRATKDLNLADRAAPVKAPRPRGHR